MDGKLSVLVIALPFLTACAAYPERTSEITQQKGAILEATCTKVMGLTKGEAEFSGCVSSLAATIADQLQVAATNRAYHDCEKMGLKNETPDFSRCVLDWENGQLALGKQQTSPTSDFNGVNSRPKDREIGSYFQMTFDERHRQEQYSCAELGVDPGSGDFVSCVNDLDATLFGIEHPNT
jgi:hypothetical protein